MSGDLKRPARHCRVCDDDGGPCAACRPDTYEAETAEVLERIRDAEFVRSFTRVQTAAHENAVAKGFHDVDVGDPTRIALMHSELSEALEGLRHGNPPDDKIPEFTAVEAELADVVIRIMDNAGLRGWRVAEAILAKMRMNAGRTRMHGGKAF